MRPEEFDFLQYQKGGYMPSNKGSTYCCCISTTMLNAGLNTSALSETAAENTPKMIAINVIGGTAHN
jgi:hypothetical protein